MQGRPCAVDPDYCNVRMVTTGDFPDPTDPRAAIFIQWVRLCEIIGRVGKAIAQGKMGDLTSSPATDLISWAQGLDAELQLPLSTARTTHFNRDIHLLHLPYLATIILLHLQKGTQKLPKASATAIVAASCVARVFEDFLARGTLRFVPGQAGWYISISILALLYARQVEDLQRHADADIATLRAALEQMATRWHSSKMFSIGFQKISESSSGPGMGQSRSATGAQDAMHATIGRLENPQSQLQVSPTLDDLTATEAAAKWTDCFPYITEHSSPLIAVLLTHTLQMPLPIGDIAQFTYLFDFLDGLDPELLNVDLNL
jgi:hypothetical protein